VKSRGSTYETDHTRTHRLGYLAKLPVTQVWATEVGHADVGQSFWAAGRWCDMAKCVYCRWQF